MKELKKSRNKNKNSNSEWLTFLLIGVGYLILLWLVYYLTDV